MCVALLWRSRSNLTYTDMMPLAGRHHRKPKDEEEKALFKEVLCTSMADEGEGEKRKNVDRKCIKGLVAAAHYILLLHYGQKNDYGYTILPSESRSMRNHATFTPFSANAVKLSGVENPFLLYMDDFNQGELMPLLLTQDDRLKVGDKLVGVNSNRDLRRAGILCEANGFALPDEQITVAIATGGHSQRRTGKLQYDVKKIFVVELAGYDDGSTLPEGGVTVTATTQATITTLDDDNVERIFHNKRRHMDLKDEIETAPTTEQIRDGWSNIDFHTQDETQSQSQSEGFVLPVGPVPKRAPSIVSIS